MPSYRFIDDGDTLSIQAKDGVAPLPKTDMTSFGFGATSVVAGRQAMIWDAGGWVKRFTALLVVSAACLGSQFAQWINANCQRGKRY